jgi:hypothetical protein
METKNLKRVEVEGYVLYIIIILQITMACIAAILFSNIQILIAFKYYVPYIILIEFLTLFFAYKNIKANLSNKVAIMFALGLIVLLCSIFSTQFILVDILLNKKSDDHIVRCVKIKKIYSDSEHNVGYSVRLETSNFYIPSLSYNISEKEKETIEKLSCACMELKLYKSLIGFHYVKNKGIIKKCKPQP